MRQDGEPTAYIAHKCNVSSACVRRYTADITVDLPPPMPNAERYKLMLTWGRPSEE